MEFTVIDALETNESDYTNVTTLIQDAVDQLESRINDMLSDGWRRDGSIQIVDVTSAYVRAVQIMVME